MTLDPSAARDWVRIFRDAAIVVCGIFMLVYETAFATEPNPIVIGASLTLLGIPGALRLDDAFRKGKKE